MKRKKLLFTVGGIFTVVALATMLLFVFSGDEITNTPNTVTIDLDGTWKVAAYFQAGSTNLPDREYFVFTDDSATAYRSGESQPYATSSYELTAEFYPNLELSFPDISRKYAVSVVTDNYIRLYESSSVYMELIRYANDDLSDLNFSEDVVVGSWNVVYRNTAEVISEEKIYFEDGILNDYRNGSSDPVASVPYYWNEKGCLCVDDLGAEMLCYPLSKDVIFFVEISTGYVWELHSAK